MHLEDGSTALGRSCHADAGVIGADGPSLLDAVYDANALFCGRDAAVELPRRDRVQNDAWIDGKIQAVFFRGLSSAALHRFYLRCRKRITV